MGSKQVTFPSGELSLEGIIAIPPGVEPFPAVVVCHPHPLYGGSMDNNVVSGIAEALLQVGVISFKFNFRGVGGSQGTSGQGKGEQEDALAAISFLATAGEVDRQRIGLAGYSAGASFALPVCHQDERIKALAAVSLPLGMSELGSFKDCTKPKLLLSGANDDFTPADRFLEFCQGLADPKECHTIEGADHFWVGHEAVMAKKVSSFFGKVL